MAGLHELKSNKFKSKKLLEESLKREHSKILKNKKAALFLLENYFKQERADLIDYYKEQKSNLLITHSKNLKKINDEYTEGKILIIKNSSKVLLNITNKKDIIHNNKDNEGINSLGIPSVGMDNLLSIPYNCQKSTINKQLTKESISSSSDMFNLDVKQYNSIVQTFNNSCAHFLLENLAQIVKQKNQINNKGIQIEKRIVYVNELLNNNYIKIKEFLFQQVDELRSITKNVQEMTKWFSPHKHKGMIADYYKGVVELDEDLKTDTKYVGFLGRTFYRK